MRKSHVVTSAIVLAVALTPPLLAAVKADVEVPARPTFTKDVLPILQENCQACHRPQGLNLGGMVAPMPLTSYDEVRPWAKAVARAVKSRTMPPWHASPEQHGVFMGERTLTDAEIETVARWAATGALRGNPEDAPAPLDFPSDGTGWAIGEPDLVVELPEPYLVEDDVEDEYVTIPVQLTEEMLPEDRWIKAVEFRPGSEAVHHIIARPIGGIAPGYQPKVYREGISALLRKGTTVAFQMHYHKEPGPGTAVYDQSEVAVRFYEPGEEIRYVVEGDPLGTFRFVIPPGESNYSDHASYTFEKDAQILAFNPHMHLRGKAAKYVAVFPDGREQALLHVPQYDFNWQTTYTFEEPVAVPAGTRIDLTLWWDNSAENEDNPDPTVAVRWGRPTTAEMGFGWMSFVDAAPRSIVAGQEIPADVLELSERERRRGGEGD
jgi:mono/diheme cytochrome c family protein